jgi:hypothetical protein
MLQSIAWRQADPNWDEVAAIEVLGAAILHGLKLGLRKTLLELNPILSLGSSPCQGSSNHRFTWLDGG